MYGEKAEEVTNAVEPIPSHSGAFQSQSGIICVSQRGAAALTHHGFHTRLVDMSDRSGISVSGPDTFRRAVLYVVLSLAIASYGGYDYVQQTEAVRDSVQVNATITALSIDTESGTSSNPGTEYDPVVEFEYTYNGTQYTGTQLYPAAIEQTYETRSAAESALEEYEQGAQTTAYVEPDEPSNAFLRNETSNAPLIAIGIGGTFALLSAVSALRKI